MSKIEVRVTIFLVVIFTAVGFGIALSVETGNDIKQNCIKTELVYGTRSGSWSHVYDCSNRGKR